jgi:hypothetical protein
MHPTVRAARIAGAIYLSMVVTGPFSLMYVPGKLIVKGNATATAGNILAHETMFRLAIVADLLGSVIFICLAIALYRLFNGVNKTQARLLVGLVLVSSAVGFMNVVNNLAALLLFRGSDFLTVFDQPQREALGMLFVRLHSQGIVINELFWGLWLFPFALLVYQSRFLPRFLGVWLALGGFAYVILSLTGLLLPQYSGSVFTYSQPAFFGEIAIMLWLLIRGANMKRVPQSAIA